MRPMNTPALAHEEPEMPSSDTDQPPTLRMHEIPTLPSAISVQPLPAFDAESTRFFAAPALADGALDDDLVEWWIDQRRRSLAPFVAAIVAACVLLLAAVAR